MRIQAWSFFKQPSLFIYRLIRTIADQWRAWPWSVPSKPARLGPGRIQLSFQLAFMCCWQNFVKLVSLIPVMFVWCLSCLWAQLKSEVAASFGEALQRKLLEVEGLYSQARSRYTFIQALVRRIRGLLRQPKNWRRHIYTKTGKDILYTEWKVLPIEKKQEMRHFTFCDVFFVLWEFWHVVRSLTTSLLY